MKSAALRNVFEIQLGSRFELHPRPLPETMPSGIPEIDRLTGGFPRGALTEITGPSSSGRTTLLHSAMASFTALEEFCALVDASDAFDPISAAVSGVDLNRLLWIRCRGNAEHAMKAVDMLLQSGGFGLVVMDLGDTPQRTARRISLTSWFRFRRAVEHTPTVFMAVEREPNARSCASLVVELRRGKILWTGMRGCSRLLRGARMFAEARKPACPSAAEFEARLAG